MLTIREILFATDFSPPSQHALKYACELAEKFDSQLHVLHVLQDLMPFMGEPGMLMPNVSNYLIEVRESAQRALQDLPPKEYPAAGQAVRVLRSGSPFLEIVRYVKEAGIDLIVIGTHGRTGLKHVLMGSVAENVVRKAHCPVLTVRPPTQQFEMP
jgi:nucleotide-binding universal stress UspA family protein